MTYKPYYRKNNRWVVRFPDGILTDNKTSKTFKSEEEAKLFVLELIPDAYDDKIETERCCIDCKHILAIEHFKTSKSFRRFCKSCGSSRELKVRHHRNEKGICRFVNCNNSKLLNSGFCYNHWFSHKAGDHLGDSQLGINLINIYERQNRRCVYTGIGLIPNDNMSLDHIISRYDAPELASDINNLQWVHKDINQMKTKFSHNAFIILCKHIANRF